MMPAGEWESLPDVCGTAWSDLTSGQQRALVILFDTYAERVDEHTSAFRSLTEASWRRFVLEVMRTGPKRLPLLPINLMHELHAAASCSRPAREAPFAINRARVHRGDTALHLDFGGFVELLAAVAECWRGQQACAGLTATAAAGTKPAAALAALLHEVACTAFETEMEDKITRRLGDRPPTATATGSPQMKLWDLLLLPPAKVPDL